MRLFIASLFDENTIERLSKERDALHNLSVSGSFVSRDNIHLTLEFLGECTQEECDEAVNAMDMVERKRFHITMDRRGFFSRPDGNTWWIGIEESSALMSLQGSLHRELVEHGLRVEKRRYKPHITLGRRVVTEVAACRISPITACISSFSLMLSERGTHGMVYTELFRKNLL